MIREQTARSPAGAMLYDARYAGQFDARWFDPAYWQTHGDARATVGGRGAAWFVTHGDERWVLRRFRRGGLVRHFVGDLYLWTGLDRARAFTEWRLLAWAHAAGLPVPRPIAALVERVGPFARGALLTERLDARPLAELVARSELDATVWRAIGASIRRCHDAGLDHADLNLHNVLIGRDSKGWIIDLDRGVRRDAPGAWRERNLARLARSLAKLTAGSCDDAARARALAALRAGYADG